MAYWFCLKIPTQARFVTENLERQGKLKRLNYEVINQKNRLLKKEIYRSLSTRDIDRIVEMAWEDRTTFDAIQQQFGLSEPQVIGLMRAEMKQSSFKMWRERVTGRNTKHNQKRDAESVKRFKSKMQKGLR